jgi:hypothetical protein
MEEVEVPRVPAFATVYEALVRMRDEDRSVVCADLRSGPRLLFFQDLWQVPAQDRTDMQVQKVDGGIDAVGIPIPGGSIAGATPHAIQRGLGVTLSSSGRRFAVVGFYGDKARVVADPDELYLLREPFPKGINL